MSDQLSNSDSWDVEASEEDRERARSVLLDRLRAGVVGYEEYESRLHLIQRARYVGDLYSATFSRRRLFLAGPKWNRRMVRVDIIGVLVVVVLIATSTMMRWLSALGLVAAALLVLLNVGFGIQWARFRRSHKKPSRTGHSIG
ncbi:MAG: DUF1707 domain-containing protein [Ferrimicrobium sp.]